MILNFENPPPPQKKNPSRSDLLLITFFSLHISNEMLALPSPDNRFIFFITGNKNQPYMVANGRSSQNNNKKDNTLD